MMQILLLFFVTVHTKSVCVQEWMKNPILGSLDVWIHLEQQDLTLVNLFTQIHETFPGVIFRSYFHWTNSISLTVDDPKYIERLSRIPGVSEISCLGKLIKKISPRGMGDGKNDVQVSDLSTIFEGIGVEGVHKRRINGKGVKVMIIGGHHKYPALLSGKITKTNSNSPSPTHPHLDPHPQPNFYANLHLYRISYRNFYFPSSVFNFSSLT
eukprot:TRINITY_DN13164_c0_g1_i1.p1 TRINITY_DN13164_c0_g1~~TRINITY_DN13164_c0_g1_i1.p1  ORF type:complete len:211 (-),score=31.29 TRINITY_DN13164_c0_g1_i1:104-736(-)